MKQELEARFDMKTVIVGHDTSDDVASEGKILNRVIRATSSGWEYECGQRHVEVLIEELGLKGKKAVVTPGID